MDKPDARLLNPSTQDYLRQQAIRLRTQGKRMGEIAADLGVHRTTIKDRNGLRSQSKSISTLILCILG